MNHLWRTIAAGALVAAHGTSGFGQTAEQSVVLTIEINSVVFYRGDVTDPAKMARDPQSLVEGLLVRRDYHPGVRNQSAHFRRKLWIHVSRIQVFCIPMTVFAPGSRYPGCKSKF